MASASTKPDQASYTAESPKIYKIATNPDTVIVLTRPLVDFAVWPKKTEKAQLGNGAKTVPAAVGRPSKCHPHEIQSSLFSEGRPGFSSVLAEAHPKMGASDAGRATSSESTDAGAALDGPQGTEDSSASANEIPKDTIHYHVSSQHLIQASPYFF
ncbi:hypothetical protein K458DRAFT_398674 [Lentithecium fluviatile CBS 122367]|uniref:Uncharacterized protein n=1 Tax=Lentithecium fluviatile CBS 122367 TaxID=1168545 RepID=A0A6G1JKI8_9PLEO|nr:hypothetical protein K458DRAFT_398674 [Lentithecium fluviatile CBS 122367]